MALPVNINELITGKTVEWERIEFKEGWDPYDVIHTVCAFANDINNWGGGYVILGIKEKDGMPLLPPQGVDTTMIDNIQKEMLGLCHLLRPNYFPIIEPVEFMGKTILVIWVPGGEIRPYKAPDNPGKQKTFSYYVRRFSSTKKANQDEERDLLRMSAHVPFDDQVQPKSEITDLKLPLIQDHLATIGSNLLEQSRIISFPELCRKMNIVAGPDEYLKPKNIGLLLFNSDPSQFFPCARIDLVQFKDETGDVFTEKYFSGPIQKQLEDALLYIKNSIITEKVTKVEGEAHAVRVFNYPYEAIEEALVNTVYHRSYQDDDPIELRIFPNRVEMISYPGPLPPITKEKLHAGDIVARKYRNRRIGDFLKELHLTEGRGTGIPKIKKAMRKNGSPAPIFDTDDELSYFLTTLPINAEWLAGLRDQDGDQDGDQAWDQDGDQDGDQAQMIVLRYCLRPKKRREIMMELGVYNNHKSFVKYIKSLIEKGYLTQTIPDKPTSGKQQYKTTPDGEQSLKAREGEG